jgi:adenylate cyclase
MSGILEEIKRRNVFKVAIVYLIAGWLTMQVVDVMFPALKLPEWIASAVAALLLLGFPFAVIFAWAFEITPEGIKREKDVDRTQSITPQTGQKLNRAAFLVLTIAVGFLLLDKFVLQPGPGATAPIVDAPAAVSVKPSIAVLPFVNMSDETANEYFSDGLSEELLNLLAKIPRLHVAGRTSSFRFKDTNEDLRSIGEQLNVAHVLEGSVRKSGSKLRITAQLIDTENGYHLWSETYDREMTDIFAIQDEISASVVSALRVALLGDELENTDRGTDNIDAYNLFLQGLFFLQHTSDENIQKALASFQKAVELDPDFARAYLGLAIATQQDVSGWAGSSGGEFIEGFERIRKYADMAMAIDDEDSDAYAAQMVVSSIADWNFVRSIELGKKALELNPANVSALAWLASAMLFDGDAEQSLALLDQSLIIDPLNITAIRFRGDVLAVTGELAEARTAYETVLNLSPESFRIHGRLARTYLYGDDLESARGHANQEPVAWVREMLEIIILRREGNMDAWQQAVIGYEAQYGAANSYQLAEVYADAGDLDQAFNWLEAAAEVKDPGTPWSIASPLFAEARNDPRWLEFESNFVR